MVPAICALRAHDGKLTFWVTLAEHPAAFETLSVTGKLAGPDPGKLILGEF